MLNKHVWRYGGAMLGIGVASLLAVSARHILEGRASYAIIFLASVLIGQLCGVGPSLLSVGVGCVVWVRHVVPFPQALDLRTDSGQLLLLYSMVGLVIALVGKPGRAARRATSRRALPRTKSATSADTRVATRAGTSTATKADTAVIAPVDTLVDTPVDTAVHKLLIEERLRVAFDSIPVLVSYVDTNGYYRICNRGYDRWFGISCSELAGQHVRDVVGEAAWAAIVHHVEAALAGKPVTYECRVSYRNGDIRHIRADYIPHLDESGACLGFSALVQDLTAHRQAEMFLMERAAQFQHLTELVNDGIWILDGIGRIVALNKRVTGMLGYEQEEMLGRFEWDFCVEEDGAKARESFERRRRGGVDRVPLRLRHRDGRTVWSMMTTHPLLDEHGVLRGGLDTLVDVSEQKRVEEALSRSDERLHLVAEAAEVGFWFWDLVTDGLEWTDTCKRLFGIPPGDEISRKRFIACVIPEDRERVLGGVERSRAGMVDFAEEFRLRLPDGSLRWISALGRTTRSEDGAPLHMSGVATDITVRKQAEETLYEADRRKDQFLATLAHELRNPLAPARNAVQILRALGSGDEKLRWARDVIDRQVTQMSRLVDDLLDVSRITRGKIQLRKERLILADTVSSALETSRPLIDASRHQLVLSMWPEPLEVEADATRLAQVLANLLNNAAKYTEDGGHIWLTVTREGSEAVIRVRDDGVGMAEDTLPHIFDMFTQGNRSLERSQGGLGIGLTLVKQLVAMHGGTVAVHSDGPGKGSEFSIRLPLVAAEEEQPGDEISNRSEESGETSRRPCCRVLVVDDNEDSAETLGLLLKVNGHEVYVAYQGYQALKIAQSFGPDVVLLDIGLPDISGYEVARRMREQPGLKDVVLVAQTGWGQEEDRKQSRAAGFDYHLVKPIDLEMLHSLLANICAAPTGASP